MFRKIKYLAIASVFIYLLIPAASLKVYAAIPIDCPDGYSTTVATADRADNACVNHQTGTSQSDDLETQQPASNSVTPAGGNPDADCKPDPPAPLDAQNCGIIHYLLTGINLLSGLVGLVVVIMIAVGGIQYTTARDNPQAVAAAKARITNAIIALVASLFIYAFLQYIVPGGVL